ncbi:MAG: hypothetical protein ACYC7D_01545 [Nitrososphaerales archaeon]
MSPFGTFTEGKGIVNPSVFKVISEPPTSPSLKRRSQETNSNQSREIYIAILGKKEAFYAFCTTVRMKHLDGVKVRLVISYRNGELSVESSFYISNVRIWEPEKILLTYAYRWSIGGFHKDAKQSLGLGDYQLRKIQGVKRHVSMVFFAYIILQLRSFGF